MNFVFKVFIFIFCLNTFGAKGQEKAMKNFERYALLNKNNGILFVHFDKTEYTNFEKVYFTAYLIKSRVHLNKHTVLYLSLVRNKDNSVVYQDKFFIENGFSFGEFKMPDSVTSGNYRFVINTDIKVNDKPEMGFTQPIVVKSLYIDPLVPSASLKSAYDERTKEGSVLFRTMTNNLRFVSDAVVEYTVNTNGKIVKIGEFKTNSIGEGQVNYPANQIIPDSSYIEFKVSKFFDPIRNKDLVDMPVSVARKLKFYIPNVKKLFYISNFYPEGGYLVNGLTSKVGLEFKDSDGNLINGSLVILENDFPIDTVKCNSVGIGKFSLMPKIGFEYTAKLLDQNISKQVFRLPKALNKGCVLNVPNAVVDSVLLVKIQTNTNQKISLLAHNYKDAFVLETLNLTANKVLQIKIDLRAIPTGLNTITILDSTNRPISERMFFTKYSSVNPVKIDLDTINFKSRNKVNAYLSILDNYGSLKDGLVSIAVVRTDKVSTLYSQNITDYVYLDEGLKGVPQHPNGYKIGDKQFLEDVLLIKYWRRYKWPDSIVTLDTVNLVDKYKFTDNVLNGKNLIKEPVELAVVSGGYFKILSTDSNGYFEFKNEDIFKQNDKRLLLSPVNGIKKSFKYKLNDPLNNIKSFIEKTSYVDPFYRMYSLNETVLKQTASNGINLKEVTIKGSKSENNYIFNKCGDYVCYYNILNCFNHFADPRNRLPVKGEEYLFASSLVKMVYAGCDDIDEDRGIQLIRGINLPKEFYVSDVKNLNEPINFSIIYWDYQRILNSKQSTPLSFYTGDLTGKFKVIVQGMTENGFVYGEKEFVVNK